MRNQNGFTLISMMLALSIFTVALILAGSLLHMVSSRFKDDLSVQKEINLFFAQTATELHLSDAVSTSPDHQKLFIEKGNEKVNYERSNPQRVIRLVSGQGYEIVLQHVKSIRFDSDGRFLAIQITDSNNRQFFWADMLYKKRGAANESAP
ncbi:competence type IV pilus minor pilin ComGF [Sporolactobacillus pectinivorans]|uniref:competence type IV pilus minor pilin ComGF n=1 Tax=Sporolactobacillus pectinivorans TaxID=1591408 RepID=UPI000C26642F|nr:competence type IV pilus minor pilin ComGF [Sporolactobacillus pectinivorans]